MRFVSTRGSRDSLRFSEAVQKGVAFDHGLFVPEDFPSIEVRNARAWPDFGVPVLSPFLEGDPLENLLSDICERAFDFPLELKFLDPSTAVLELFHGPTAAFKDVGARFLSEVTNHLQKGTRKTVLVATSGDTGGAVASAFHRKPDTTVFVLFPKGKISPLQEKQLTCWGENVTAFSVRGDFDDCQRMVKEAFADLGFTQRNLLSANSINLGRLLPQMVYYAFASSRYFSERNRKPGFIIPSGNLGNAVAAFWTRRLGFPIREIILATNANHSVPDYFNTGSWKPHATIPTLANAMDVGNPSNMERLIHLFPDLRELKQVARAVSVRDPEISKAIVSSHQQWSQVWCPHTAAAAHVRQRLSADDWIIVATAHPAKFREIVEPLLGRGIQAPPVLMDLLSRPSHCVEIAPKLEALKAALE